MIHHHIIMVGRKLSTCVPNNEAIDMAVKGFIFHSERMYIFRRLRFGFFFYYERVVFFCGLENYCYRRKQLLLLSLTFQTLLSVQTSQSFLFWFFFYCNLPLYYFGSYFKIDTKDVIDYRLLCMMLLISILMLSYWRCFAWENGIEGFITEYLTPNKDTISQHKRNCVQHLSNVN